MRKISLLFFTVLLNLSCSSADLRQEAPGGEADSLSIISHIKYLADDKLKGRYPGTEGDELTDEYLISEFSSYGLSTVPGHEWKQPFEVTVGVSYTGENRLEISGHKFVLDDDFRPLGFSGLGSASSSAVFGDYGPGVFPEQKYPDIEGKWLILLASSPELPDSLMDAARAPVQKKVLKARDLGAVGVIFIDPGDSTLPQLRFDQRLGVSGIPVLQVNYASIEKLFTAHAASPLPSLITGMKHSGRSMAQELEGMNISAAVGLERETAVTHNVLAYLEGSDPEKKDKVIIIGAHKDHLGMGGYGTSSTKPEIIAVHNGADDNASGTAGVLELARIFATAPDKTSYSILFIIFGAEEMGTLGSSYYTEHPYIANEKTVTMINMDMIGRMQARKLIVFATESSKDFQGALRGLNHRHGFDLAFNGEGVGPSDHGPFYNKEVPSVFFFTGTHKDYHSPSDDTEFIEAGKQADLVNYIRDFVYYLDQRSAVPAFRKIRSSGKRASRSGMKVSLGITPDFASGVKGLRIKAVTEGKTGHAAGLQAGDVITAIDGKEIGGIREYMYRMQEFRPGESAQLSIVRSGESMELTVNF